jgi:hypothetical protein
VLILYIYDIKAKDRKKFNRTKRLFYYHLNRMPIDKELWKSKSAIAIRPKMEKMMDSLFKRFGNAIEVYKVVAKSIEALE